MNLTYGEDGKCSYPICYVLWDKQADLTRTHQLCTAAKTEQLYCQAVAALTVQDYEVLKPKGICMIKVK